jgi:hypothetical protein
MAFGARTDGVSVRSREDERERTGLMADGLVCLRPYL